MSNDFFNNILPLISTALGAAISYYGTRGLEKQKFKMEFQRNNLEKILIPYCTCLEKIKLPRRIAIRKSSDIFNEFLKNLYAPKEYLNASKRVYISKNSIQFLGEYVETLKDFDMNIESNRINFLQEYKGHIKDVLSKFESINLNYDDILIKFKEGTEDKIKMKIIGAIPNFEILVYISNMTFISIEGNSFDVLWEIDIDDTDENNHSMSDILVKYLHCNIDNEEVSSLFEKYSMEKLIKKLLKQVELMKKQVIKEIDEITII